VTNIIIVFWHTGGQYEAPSGDYGAHYQPQHLPEEAGTVS